jgi:hypothetical protein
MEILQTLLALVVLGAIGYGLYRLRARLRSDNDDESNGGGGSGGAGGGSGSQRPSIR